MSNKIPIFIMGSLLIIYLFIFLTVRSISISSLSTSSLNSQLDDLESVISSLEAKLNNLESRPKVLRIHEKDDYENGWILKVDSEQNSVTVQTDLSKTLITFKVVAEELSDFPLGTISAPVTLECTKMIKKKCDFNKPFKVYIAGRYVEVVSIS